MDPLADLFAFCCGPIEAAEFVQPATEPVMYFKQIRHVRSRVPQLVLPEWPAQPVGEAVAFGKGGAKLALVQFGKRGKPKAEKAGGKLGVEHGGGNDATGQLENFEILCGRVEHNDHVIAEEPAEGRDIDR